MDKRLLFPVVGMVLALVTANCGGGSCPCGADPDEPIELHDASFGGSHLLEHSCSCQCGDDDPASGELSSIGVCVDHGESCYDRLGRAAEVVCEGPSSDF
ncbi:MAG: hypothetical protein ACPG4T_18090 [Nannocystaceae bacterium]